jgi:hypothetical protein
VLCTAVFAGTALAGDNDAPGRSGDAPGQEKKEEQEAQPAQPGNSANAPGQEQKAEVQAQIEVRAEAKAEAVAEAKTESKGQQKKAEQQAAREEKKADKAAEKAVDKEAKPAQAAKPDGPQGQSALAHHHVIVCHRTGSASNPYVVINIPMTAWINAHAPGGHPELDGRNDFILKDPASRPGSKDGFSKSACEAGGGAATTTTTTAAGTTTSAVGCPGTTQTVTEQVGGYVMHKTGSEKNPYVIIRPSEGSAHYDHSKHPDDIIVAGQTITKTIQVAGDCNQSGGVTTTTTTTTSGGGGGTTTVSLAAQTTAQGQSAPAGGSSPEASGVAGAISPAQAGQAAQPAGGVLGETAQAAQALGKTAASGTLPFTGIPLWVAALIGAALLAAGLTLRRSA